MLLRVSNLWFNVKLRKQRLGQDEEKVLRAIFEIEGGLGSLIRPIHLPEKWGYASRRVIANCIGWDSEKDSVLRKVSRITKFLAAEGFLYLKVVAAAGNVDDGATRFRLCKRSLRVVRMIWNSMVQRFVPLIFGVSGTHKDLEQPKTVLKSGEGLFEAWNRMGLSRGTSRPAVS